jgi:hypothetical protein
MLQAENLYKYKNLQDWFILFHLFWMIFIVTELPDGRSGFQIPAGLKDFPVTPNVRNGERVHPSSYSVGARILSRGVKWVGHEVDGWLHLVPRLKMDRTMPHPTPFAFMTYAGTAWTVLPLALRSNLYRFLFKHDSALLFVNPKRLQGHFGTYCYYGVKIWITS